MVHLSRQYGYRADDGETFIVKSNGEFILARKQKYQLEPGDMILVPSKKEYNFIEGMTLWVTIVAQFASVAGVIIALQK